MAEAPWLDPFQAPPSDDELRAQSEAAQAALPQWGDDLGPAQGVTQIGGDPHGYGYQQGPDPETMALIDPFTQTSPTDAPQAQAAAPQPSGAQQALEGAYGSSLAQWQANEEALARMQPYTVSKPNVAAPIIKGRAREALAGEGAPTSLPEFQPEPFHTPQRIAGENDRDYMERVALAKQAHDADQALAAQEHAAASAQMGAVPAARDVGKDGNIGEIEAERRLSEQATQAQIAGAERMAGAQVQAAQAERDAIAEQRMLEQDRRDEMERQRAAMDRLGEIETAARAKLEAVPQLNGRRFVENMGLGEKIAAIAASAFGGWGGQPGSTIEMIERAAQQDLAEQQANYQQAVTGYEAAKGAVNQGMDIYRTIMDGLGDEGVAGQVYLDMVMEDGAAMLRQEAAEAELPELKAFYEQEALAAEQRLRDRRDQTKLTVATTADKISHRVDPYRHERKRLEERQERVEAHLDKLELAGIDVAEKREGREATLEGERIKAEATREAAAEKRLRGEGGIYREAASLASKIAPKEAALQQLSDLRRDFKDGIPGVGAFAGTETAIEWGSGIVEGKASRAREFEKRVENIVERGLREATGANAPEPEVDKYMNLIMEDAASINGEAKVWQNIDAFEEYLRNEVDVYKRGVSPEALEYFTRNKAEVGPDPINIGRAPSREVVRRK